MKNLTRGSLVFILVLFLLFVIGCVTLEIRRIPIVTTPSTEKIAPQEAPLATEKDQPDVDYYNIYLCNKLFKELDLDTVLSLNEESPNYCITTYKPYNIDLKNQILSIKDGSAAFACTSSSQTKDGNHKYVKMQATNIKIALDHQWMTCIVEEKVKDKEEYYVTVYGREISTYKLLLPRTKVEVE